MREAHRTRSAHEHEQHHRDPVCQMQVDKRRAAGDLHYNHRTYWFCSLACVERFARRPEAFVQP